MYCFPETYNRTPSSRVAQCQEDSQFAAAAVIEFEVVASSIVLLSIGGFDHDQLVS